MKGIHSIKIKGLESESDISHGLNTQLYIDEKKINGVKSISYHVSYDTYAEISIKMIGNIEIYSDFKLEEKAIGSKCNNPLIRFWNWLNYEY